MPTAADKEDFKKQLALNYIDYNDYKVNSIITGYIVQTHFFFFLTDRNPFCRYAGCGLFTLIGKRI
jgi:hypothetical protein